MILHNVNILGEEGLQHIRVDDEKIKAVTPEWELAKNKGEISIKFNNAVAFPGLINSHDHLDFNLFPLLGNQIYRNYAEWGRDIHEKNKEAISAVLKVPRELRTQWGLYKNLLNGITTVINHGERLEITNDIITVFQDCYSLHSIQFEKDWKYKLNQVFSGEWPYVIHIGEGTDTLSKKEIRTFIKWNFLKKKVIAVHAVSMNEKQAENFLAVVWCPASNYFLLNATAAINMLKKKTKIIFGTDSTLTAGWNLWEQLRLARKQQMINDAELFDALTATASSVWGLNAGAIAKDKTADIVVALKKDNENTMDAFYLLNPEDILLVLHKGNINLFDEKLKDQLLENGISIAAFSKIQIKEVCKYIRGDLPGLIKQVQQYAPHINFPVAGYN